MWTVTKNLLFLAGLCATFEERLGVQILLAGAVNIALEDMNRTERSANCKAILSEYTSVADTGKLEGDPGALKAHVDLVRRLRGIIRQA